MNLYYGIDVASQKHNCCVVDEKERVLYEFSFQNDKEGFIIQGEGYQISPLNKNLSSIHHKK